MKDKETKLESLTLEFESAQKTMNDYLMTIKGQLKTSEQNLEVAIYTVRQAQ